MKPVFKRFVVAALIFSLLSLSLFIVASAHHDHDPDYCPVCVRIETAAGILKGLVSAMALVFCVRSAISFITERCSRDVSDCRTCETPVFLCVKLNN